MHVVSHPVSFSSTSPKDKNNIKGLVTLYPLQQKAVDQLKKAEGQYQKWLNILLPLALLGTLGSVIRVLPNCNPLQQEVERTPKPSTQTVADYSRCLDTRDVLNDIYDMGSSMGLITLLIGLGLQAKQFETRLKIEDQYLMRYQEAHNREFNETGVYKNRIATVLGTLVLEKPQVRDLVLAKLQDAKLITPEESQELSALDPDTLRKQLSFYLQQ